MRIADDPKAKGVQTLTLHPRHQNKILMTATDDGKPVTFVAGRVYALENLNTDVQNALYKREYLAEDGTFGNRADYTTLLVETTDAPTEIAPAGIAQSGSSFEGQIASLNEPGVSIEKETAKGAKVRISAPDTEAFAELVKALGIKPAALLEDDDAHAPATKPTSSGGNK